MATALAFATQAFCYLSLSTRLPDLRETWSVGNTTLSVLLLMMVLLAGLGSVLMERVATRYDSALGLRIGLALITVSVPGVLLSPSLAPAIVALAGYGIGLGMVDAGTNMQAVALEHRYARPILPSLHGAWTLGAILGALGTLITGDLAHQWLALVGVVPLLVLFAPHLRAEHVTAPALAKGTLALRPILLVGCAMALFYMVDVAVQTWGAAYASDVFDTTQGAEATGVFAYLIASGTVRLLGDRLVSGHGAVPVLRIGALVGCAGLVVIVIAPSWPIAVGGFVVVGAGLAVVAPLSFSAAGRMAGLGAVDEETRRARMDTVIARFNLFNYAGALLGSVLTGLVGGSDLRWGFVLPAILVLALLPLARSFVVSTQIPAGQRSE